MQGDSAAICQRRQRNYLVPDAVFWSSCLHKVAAREAGVLFAAFRVIDSRCNGRNVSCCGVG